MTQKYIIYECSLFMSKMALDNLEEKIEKVAKILLDQYEKTGDYDKIVQNKDTILQRYGKVFSRSNISNLSWDDFGGFLKFENNHHWRGIDRHYGLLERNFKKVKEALEKFLDENHSIESRIDEMFKVKGIKQATATPILMVAYPDRYGVWNGISEASLRELGLWSNKSVKGLSYGKIYKLFNEILLKLSKAMDVDLWTLDAIFWYYEKDDKRTILQIGTGQNMAPADLNPGSEDHQAPVSESSLIPDETLIIEEEAPSFSGKTPDPGDQREGPVNFIKSYSESENKELGDAGEELVLRYEREKLRNHPDLLSKIRHVSKEDDSAGYDILSYKKNGDELYIEVKTTRGNKWTPFYLSANEYETWKNNTSKYMIYRVYEYSPDSVAKFYKLSGDIGLYKPKPYVYIVSPDKKPNVSQQGHE
jgi:hypothetical protein